MVIDRSESDPFLYRSRPRPAFLLRAGWSSIDPNRIRFCTSGRFRYRCVIPDPLGLNEARSDPPPARSRPRPAFLFRAGWSSIYPNRIRFCTSDQVPISMRYPGSAWTERSQIGPASSEIDRDHIPPLYSGPDGHSPVRNGCVLYIWPGSYIHALSFEISTMLNELFVLALYHYIIFSVLI